MKVLGLLVMLVSTSACATTNSWPVEKKVQILTQCTTELQGVGAPKEISEHFCVCLVPKVEAAVAVPTEAAIRAFMQSPEGDKAGAECVADTQKKFGI